jgi:hypothetical protein
MAEEIQIQVNANTGQAQTNINGLDKSILVLIENIKLLNTTMSNNVKATNDLASGMKTVNESVNKNTVSIGQLRSAIGSFGGEIGEAASSALMLGQNLINVAATMGPVGLAIAGLVATLALVKEAITDTQEGQDAWDGFIDNMSYKFGQFKEAIFKSVRDIVKVLVDFYNTLDTISNQATATRSKEWMDHYNSLKTSSEKFQFWLKSFNKSVSDDINGQDSTLIKVRESAKKTLDDLDSMFNDSSIGDHWKKIFEDNSALFEAEAKAFNNMGRSMEILTGQTDIFTDRIADTVDIVADLDYNVDKATNAILSMRKAQGLYNKDLGDSQKNIDNYINSLQNEFELYFKGSKVTKDQIKDLESVSELKNTNLTLDGQQQKYLQKLYKAYDDKYKLDRKAKQIEKREERVEKQNQSRRIQAIKQISTESQIANKEITADNQLKIDLDKKGSEQEYQDKTKLISDEVTFLKESNKKLEVEKIHQAKIDDELHSSAQERKKIQNALDTQEVENDKKISSSLLNQKKLDEAWRVQQIKNRYSQIEADDEMAILNAKDGEETYKAKVQLLKDEMTEKVKILGLTDEQVGNLSDKAQRDELVKQGVMTGEMVKDYEDYLLKVKDLDDKKDKVEEENQRKLLEFQKAGVKANEDLLKDQATATQDRVDKANKAIQDETTDEVQAVKDKGAKLIESANGDADTILSIKKSMQDQIDDIDQKSTDKQITNQQSLFDKKISQFDSLTSAVDDWNQVLKGSANVSKAIEEGQAVINTLGAANKALNAKYSPEGTTDMVLRIAAVAATLANGYAQVKKISETPSGGGGGSSAIPSMPSAPSMFALGQGQIQNAAGFAATRTYVLESDITSSQNRVRTVESASILGG